MTVGFLALVAIDEPVDDRRERDDNNILVRNHYLLFISFVYLRNINKTYINLLLVHYIFLTSAMSFALSSLPLIE